MRTIIEILIKLKNKLLKKQKRTDTTVEDEDTTAEMPIFLPVVSIIIAVLSLPFVVYAGERTFNKRLPRPAFVRRFSESVVGKKKSDLAPIPEGGVITEEEERPKQERSHSDSEISPVGQRAETGFSVASNETYIRGMPLSKLGVD